jgi:dedicated sortase system histidine kinase
MTLPAFFSSIRARLLLIAMLLLLIPLIGFRFIQEMDRYLRDGQQQVLASTARLLSATLSDRPQLFRAASASDPAGEVERRRLLAVFSSADPEAAADLGSAYLPSDEIERMLGVVATGSARIWVVDAHSQVRGLSGKLGRPAPATGDLVGGGKGAAPTDRSVGARIYAATIRPLLRAISPELKDANEDPREARLIVMAQVDRALVGEPNFRWRTVATGSAEILSVAQPIWQGDTIVGAVVAEETAGSGQALRSAALESLLATTLVVFVIGFAALLAFAWRLAFRVRRLQNQADDAIDVHGRIRGAISGSNAQDEIGALSRTLSSTLARLHRYNDYLEKMAARLSHELRTPVAVVRSSLDNLRACNLPAPERVYLNRADDGVRRMSMLISRMSEATQLETMLQHAERERFDLIRLVQGCVEGYRLAYPRRTFQLTIEAPDSLRMTGSAEAIAQMLDKLVQNAADFALENTPIRIRLTATSGDARLTVENDGPLLPADATAQLFTSMVSSRPGSNEQDGHLGLGLYIVRLIAEFHGGSVNAGNSPDGRGVIFTVKFPLVDKHTA